ncbi:putative quorum-quenching lactonase YtnP [Pseudooctadecabacter jejudonensis]|uniref:Putative quorum-quenching lactonase YtnP n=2 Tax=Pseudooctadecabacter jejudonensis TaxID=1391910 RepID=A0A1Y5S2X1_9RHOB|nr:MBL fold metallo-hydrolase [Pseudooctadecabacter jejudonensis]SLN28796.1 putative quorum-quenching lactonase YtnP [Pseudooctadecabacter jejudonensis]
MKLPHFTRRSALFAGAAVPFAVAQLPNTAGAEGHAADPQNAIQNTFEMGDMAVSTLLAGSRAVDNPQGIFGMNVSEEEFAAVSAANFLPTDQSQFYFTPTVVQTGTETVLFDAGPSAAGTTAALAQAGLAPDDIDVVVLTHMHGDHIGGLTNDAGDVTFSNARYVTGQAEFDHWAGLGNDGFEAKVRPLAEKMTFIADGGDVASGVTAMAAFGHTPGHMVYMLESGGKQVLLMADLANHYVWSLAYPEWEVRFDADKAAAAAARKTVLGMVAAEKMPLIGYHMPFPGVGYVEEVDAGRFRYVPVSYQLSL